MSKPRKDAPERRCERCWTIFRPHTGRAGRYCSAHCHHEARKEATAARTEKPCSRCKVVKPIDEFPTTSGTADNRRAHCRVCGREAHRAYAVRRTYGISIEKVNEMLAAQGGGCAICGSETTMNGKAFAVDHDHKCCPPGKRACGGCVRGILCGRCNFAIGQMNDDPSLLLRAAEYLQQAA